MPEIPPALKDLVEKCICRNPSGRPQTMSTVFHELKEINKLKESSTGSDQDAIPIKYSLLARVAAKMDCSIRLALICSILWLLLLGSWMFLLIYDFEANHRTFDLQSSLVPFSTPCAVLNSSAMSTEYNIYGIENGGDTKNGFAVQGVSSYDIVLEQGWNTAPFLKASLLGSPFFIYDVFVFLRVNNSLAAVYSGDGTNIYDCHGTRLYYTCSPCQGELNIFTNENDLIWSSNLYPEHGTEFLKVYGQPLKNVVATVQKHNFGNSYRFTIMNSSHVATDPRLMLMVFSRMMFARQKDDQYSKFIAFLVLLSLWFVVSTMTLPFSCCRKIRTCCDRFANNFTNSCSSSTNERKSG